MPPGWSKEYRCGNCGGPIPSNGFPCCKDPHRTAQFVQWARRLPGATHAYERFMSIQPRTSKTAWPFWFRIVLNPFMAHGDAGTYEAGAKLCDRLHQTVEG